MKKFQFSLQRVLEYQEHICQNEKELLALLRVQLAELLQIEYSLKTKLLMCRNEYLTESKKGITAIEAAIALAYMHELRDQIAVQKVKIVDKEKEIEKQTGKLVEAQKEKKKYEKLKESKLLLYTIKDRKAQELFIEEFVAYKNSIEI